LAGVRNSTVVGRVAAVAAVAIAVIVVAVILLSGGTSYQVRLVFGDASQIVSGDEVQVAGNSVGSLSSIALTPNGRAQLTTNISNPGYVPLHQGTEATVRLTSLSGIANRYIDLRLGPGNAPTIPSGGARKPAVVRGGCDRHPPGPRRAASGGGQPRPERRHRVRSARSEPDGATRSDHERRDDVRDDRRQRQQARADVRGVPDVPERDQGDDAEAPGVLGQHRPVDQGAQPGRSAARADAALGPGAVAAAATPVHEPSPRRDCPRSATS
jgi:MlaD protein